MSNDAVPSNKPFSLVVAYDFSPQANMAFRKALTVANVNRGDVHVVVGLRGNGANDSFPKFDNDEEGTRRVKEKISQLVSEHADQHPTLRQALIHAWPAEGGDAVLSVAQDIEADLIICGTHSKSALSRLFVGSTSARLVRDAHCPVFVVKEVSYPHVEDPQVDAPCTECLHRRTLTSGEHWWCEKHDHERPYPSPLRSHVNTGVEQARQNAFVLY